MRGEERRIGRMGQTSLYIKQLFRLFINNKDWKMIIFSCVIAALVGRVVVYRMFVNMENTLLSALAISCVCLWNGVFNSVQAVCRERAIIKREHRGGMYISAYLLAHMIYQALMCAVQTILMMLIFWMSGMKFPVILPMITPFYIVDFFITLFLITYASDMMGLAVSCIVKNTTAAMTVMPLLLIFQLIFAGVVFPLSPRASMVSQLTISRWGCYTLCAQADYNNLPCDAAWKQLVALPDYVGNILQDDMTKEILEKYLPEAKEPVQEFAASQMRKDVYTYDKEHILKYWGIMIGYALLYAAIGLVALELVDRDKR